MTWWLWILCGIPLGAYAILEKWSKDTRKRDREEMNDWLARRRLP